MSDQRPWSSGRPWEQQGASQEDQPPPTGPPPAWGGTSQPPPTPGYQTPPAQHGAGGPSTDGMAIAALVVAVVSFIALPVILAVVALILVNQSRKRIAASGGALGGEGLNKAATILAWINLVLGILGLLLWVLVLA